MKHDELIEELTEAYVALGLTSLIGIALVYLICDIKKELNTYK